MTNYVVTYFIKAQRQEIECKLPVLANNAKEACQICKEEVFRKTGRNAFRPKAVKVNV